MAIIIEANKWVNIEVITITTVVDIKYRVKKINNPTTIINSRFEVSEFKGHKW